MKHVIAAISLFAGMSSVNAGVSGIDLGTGAPPASIQGIPMTSAPLDTRLFEDVTSVSLLPSITFVEFSSPLSCRRIGEGWSTWSHGYTGNAYYTNGLLSVTMTMGPFSRAFYFYAEPNPFGIFNMVATASDGSSTFSIPAQVEGFAGAHGWAFYATGGASLSSITVSSDVDFAIGEFGFDIPAPTTIAALGLAVPWFGRRRR